MNNKSQKTKKLLPVLVDSNVKKTLDNRKIVKTETYNQVLSRLLGLEYIDNRRKTSHKNEIDK